MSLYFFRKIATSKFQPTYARRAFPCFDEPSFKSTFKTTLIRPSDGGYIALSNMPIEVSFKNYSRGLLALSCAHVHAHKIFKYLI